MYWTKSTHLKGSQSLVSTLQDALKAQDTIQQNARQSTIQGTSQVYHMRAQVTVYVGTYSGLVQALKRV